MREIDLLGLAPHEISLQEAEKLLKNYLELQYDAFKSGRATDGLKKFYCSHTESSVVDYFFQLIDKIEFSVTPNRGIISPRKKYSKLEESKDAQLHPDSAIWLMRMAYYFGESLVRSSNYCEWGVGAEDTAFENMPVIKGFRNGQEASVVSICKNLVMRVKLDGKPLETVRTAINFWFKAGKPK